MKVIELRDGFGTENLRPAERPDPEPGPGQVLLGMRAASLNYRDLLMVTGRYDPRQPLPLIPCSDGVGEVLALGAGVGRVRVGDRVCPLFAQGWLAGPPSAATRSTLGGPLDGALAERMAVDAESVVKVPEHLTDAEAATLPCAAVTAWNALTLGGAVRPGDWVLVQGTGGVSIFALQLAKLFGARVVVTSKSEAKLERARALGADAGVCYRTTLDWGKAARTLADGRGVDRVIEVGGAGTLDQSLVAVRPGGLVSLIGILAGHTQPLDLTRVFMRGVRLQGILVGHRASFEALCRAVSAHGLRPMVDHVAPMADAPGELERMARGEHLGKVCLAGW